MLTFTNQLHYEVKAKAKVSWPSGPDKVVIQVCADLSRDGRSSYSAGLFLRCNLKGKILSMARNCPITGCQANIPLRSVDIEIKKVLKELAITAIQDWQASVSNEVSA